MNTTNQSVISYGHKDEIDDIVSMMNNKQKIDKIEFSPQRIEESVQNRFANNYYESAQITERSEVNNEANEAFDYLDYKENEERL